MCQHFIILPAVKAENAVEGNKRFSCEMRLKRTSLQLNKTSYIVGKEKYILIYIHAHVAYRVES